MSKVTSGKSPKIQSYEAPTVSEQPLDQGGNYVSPASASAENTQPPATPRTLGNSVIE